jgi:hypothetical protein
MSRPSRRTGPGHRTVAGCDTWSGWWCKHAVRSPDPADVTTGLASAACVQDACKRFSTKRRPADSPTREDGADLREHHQPSSEPTGHHRSGSPLNLRVRGSSPWRRTMPDLAFCTFWPICPRHVVDQSGQMRARSEQRSHASRQRSEVCGCEVRRRPRNIAPVLGTSPSTTHRLSTSRLRPPAAFPDRVRGRWPTHPPPVSRAHRPDHCDHQARPRVPPSVGT